MPWGLSSSVWLVKWDDFILVMKIWKSNLLLSFKSSEVCFQLQTKLLLIIGRDACSAGLIWSFGNLALETNVFCFYVSPNVQSNTYLKILKEQKARFHHYTLSVVNKMCDNQWLCLPPLRLHHHLHPPLNFRGKG